MFSFSLPFIFINEITILLSAHQAGMDLHCSEENFFTVLSSISETQAVPPTIFPGIHS